MFCMSACEVSVFKVCGLQRMGKEIGFVESGVARLGLGNYGFGVC